VVKLQDLYPAWIEQGLEWIAVNGQQAVDTNQAPALPAAPLPQDLMLSPEQLQLVTDYFQKVCSLPTHLVHTPSILYAQQLQLISDFTKMVF